jgi:hypothetical protein
VGDQTFQGILCEYVARSVPVRCLGSQGAHGKGPTAPGMDETSIERGRILQQVWENRTFV